MVRGRVDKGHTLTQGEDDGASQTGHVAKGTVLVDALQRLEHSLARIGSDNVAGCKEDSRHVCLGRLSLRERRGGGIIEYSLSSRAATARPPPLL